ncbi:MAG TPA: tRNA (adenosine(37)-N6)-threonylcarbamoyltransferase complex dimerization subunit type 1 TsaB [Candidatus Limnocylindria bacterium]|nr:tRNA (adenosine(37)-N6)-threonylcarbamoyltransferase complex dimerization subunit type 1 TsaB [Candidatus Limnocylindria bacterium]
MIVAFDGAATDLSVAIAEPDGSLIDDAAWSSAQRQSAELLPRLIELLAAHGREIGSTTGVAVGLGPGSFTGLRVAMALAKGLAFGLGKPLVGIPSLQAWLAAEPSASIALSRAGAREGYLLARDGNGPLIADRDRIEERLATEPVVAPGELALAFGLRNATPPRAAAEMARAAAERLANGDADNLARLEPLYLRAPRGLSDETPGEVRWL